MKRCFLSNSVLTSLKHNGQEKKLGLLVNRTSVSSFNSLLNHSSPLLDTNLFNPSNSNPNSHSHGNAFHSSWLNLFRPATSLTTLTGSSSSFSSSTTSSTHNNTNTDTATPFAFQKAMFFPTPLPLLNQEKLKTPAIDTVWKCTEIDKTGTLTETARPHSKLQFCKLHGLQPRDLRKLDARCVEQHPAILVRPSAILVNLPHLRALIKTDQCIFFDSYSSQHPMIQSLQQKLTIPLDEDMVPYEFIVLETFFQTVLCSLDEELKTLARPIHNLLFSLFNDQAQHTYLSELFVHVQQISMFEQKIQNIRDVLRDLLENDDDLNDMYLTKLARHQPIEHHDEIELLLETYLTNTEELLDAASMLLQTVTTAERLLTLSLDTQRNRLLILEIQFAMFGVACCCGSLVASLYGMNVPSGMEQEPSAFVLISMMAVSITMGVLSAGIWKMRQVRTMFHPNQFTSFMNRSTPVSFHHGLKFTST